MAFAPFTLCDCGNRIRSRAGDVVEGVAADNDGGLIGEPTKQAADVFDAGGWLPEVFQIFIADGYGGHGWLEGVA